MNKGTVVHMHKGFVFRSKVTSLVLQRDEGEIIRNRNIQGSVIARTMGGTGVWYCKKEARLWRDRLKSTNVYLDVVCPEMLVHEDGVDNNI